MPTYKRLPREKSKSVNEIASWLDHTYHWFETNWRLVLAAIGSAGVVAALVLSASFYLNSKDEKAKELYYHAAKKAAESLEAVQAFEEVIKLYPKSNPAMLARLKLADICFNKEDYGKAEEILAPMASGGSPIFRILALNNIAASRLARGDASGAAETYIKAFNDNKNPAKGLAYFNAALAYQKAGKKDEAKRILEELSKEDFEFSTPELREKVKEQLIWAAARQ